MDLPYLAPHVSPSVSSPAGYAYRHDRNRFGDRPQAIVETFNMSLRGYSDQGMGSGTLHADENMNQVDYFWDNAFKWLVELAEGRDGYKPSSYELTDAKCLLYFLEHTVAQRWNVQVLYEAYFTVMANEAMGTLRDDFSGKKARMEYLYRQGNAIPTIPLVNDFLEKFAHTLMPYPGGPIYIPLLSSEGLNWGTNSVTAWSDPIDIDGSGVIADLLTDCELSLKEIHGESSDANDKADYRLIDSLLRMLGFGTLKGAPRTTKLDPAKIEYMTSGEAFTFQDDQGAIGDDIVVYYPSYAIANNPDEWNLQRKGMLTPDDLFWCGVGPTYFMQSTTAGKFNRSTPDDLTMYGCLFRGPWALPYSHQRIYTAEDGWADIVATEDMSDSDAIRDVLWQYPWIMANPWSYYAVRQQETPENYETPIPWNYKFEMPMGHVPEYYRVRLHRDFGIPYER
jgi:hypothetical protein